jgi:hypothetical protein
VIPRSGETSREDIGREYFECHISLAVIDFLLICQLFEAPFARCSDDLFQLFAHIAMPAPNQPHTQCTKTGIAEQRADRHFHAPIEKLFVALQNGRQKLRARLSALFLSLIHAPTRMSSDPKREIKEKEERWTFFSKRSRDRTADSRS